MRLVRPALAVLVVLLTPLLSLLPVSAQTVTCDSFDAWTWAQTVMDSDPGRYAAALDPDGNGIACEALPVSGFAPVLWANTIPAGAEPVQVASIIDGDTFKVSANGVEDTIRMYHIDAPETTSLGGGAQCGGDEASGHLSYVLGFAPNGTVYLEYDQTQRDKYDRRLAYVWYQIGSDVYMVNEVMVRDGWAESDTFKPDDKYKEELDAAEQFSVQKVLGVRLQCGKFNQPADGSAGPSDEQVRSAYQRQPNQGQLPGYPGGSANPPDDGGDAAGPGRLPANPQPIPTDPPAPAPAPQPQGECDPSYPTVCIPPVWIQGDLDCGDIRYRRFQVIPPDPHNFDGDFDGVGCESG